MFFHDNVCALSEAKGMKTYMKESTETKNKLLEIARQEFLEHGYNKASMRKICKLAGVTTGAAYFFFKDKNDLFSQLVNSEAENLLNQITELEHQNFDIRKDQQYSFEMAMGNQMQQIKTMLQHMYDHKDIYVLLLCKSAGSCMENFFDDVVKVFENLNYSYIMERKDAGIIDVYFDEDTLHNLISLQISAIVEPLRHDLPKEVALKQIDAITQFFFGGWNAILKFK